MVSPNFTEVASAQTPRLKLPVHFNPLFQLQLRNSGSTWGTRIKEFSSTLCSVQARRNDLA
jgi:hypothetical protein